MKSNFRVLVLGAALIVPGFVLAAGEDDVAAFTSSPVTVAWNKSLGSDVKGYRLHYGLVPAQDYPKSVDVGNVTTYTFSNLSPGTTYHCVVTAYNAEGKETLPSNEISFSVSKSAARPKPASASLNH
jgi:hypothetical protein